MQHVKITAIGNSAGIILPKEVLARLKVDKGDTLFLVETPEGYRITPHDPVFEQQRAVARRIMKFIEPGATVTAGERVGLIRFGSRVDVFLPAGYVPAVIVGQRAISGETVLARLGENLALPRGTAQ